MIALFRNLHPKLEHVSPPWPPHPQLPGGSPMCSLTFECPGCGQRTSVYVSSEQPFHPIWKMDPGPLQLINRIKAGGDIAAQWENNFDDVTIEPSMKDLPHGRQSNCKAHFSVTRGHIIPG